MERNFAVNANSFPQSGLRKLNSKKQVFDLLQTLSYGQGPMPDGAKPHRTLVRWLSRSASGRPAWLSVNTWMDPRREKSPPSWREHLAQRCWSHPPCLRHLRVWLEPTPPLCECSTASRCQRWPSKLVFYRYVAEVILFESSVAKNCVNDASVKSGLERCPLSINACCHEAIFRCASIS